jgi:hypothetical protein
MTKWIDSPEGLMIALKHGIELAQYYQCHLENKEEGIIEWPDDGLGPLDFDTWLEEYQDYIEFMNSDEMLWTREIIRGEWE